MTVIKRQDFLNLEAYNYNELGLDPRVITDQASLKVIKNIDLDMRHSFAIVCGKNKNGVYGLATARNLLALEKYVDIYIVDKDSEDNEEFTYQLEILKKMKANISYLETIEELEGFADSLRRVNSLIDAISGIDFERSFIGPTEYIIDIINKSRIYTLSIDLPSGMDYDTGKCHSVCIDPDLVVTFEGLKEGLVKNTGFHQYKIVVEKIGLIKRGKNVRY